MLQLSPCLVQKRIQHQNQFKNNSTANGKYNKCQNSNLNALDKQQHSEHLQDCVIKFDNVDDTTKLSDPASSSPTDPAEKTFPVRNSKPQQLQVNKDAL